MKFFKHLDKHLGIDKVVNTEYSPADLNNAIYPDKVVNTVYPGYLSNTVYPGNNIDHSTNSNSHRNTDYTGNRPASSHRNHKHRQRRRLLTIPVALLTASILTVAGFAELTIDSNLTSSISNAENAIGYIDASNFSSSWGKILPDGTADFAGSEGLRVYLVKNTGSKKPSRSNGDIYNSYDILRGEPADGTYRMSTVKNKRGGNTKFDYIEGASFLDDHQTGYTTKRANILVNSEMPAIVSSPNDPEALETWLKKTETIHWILNKCYSGSAPGKLGCTCDEGTVHTPADIANCPLMQKVVELDLKLVYEPLVLVKYLGDRYALTGTEFHVLTRDFGLSSKKGWKMAGWGSPEKWKGKAVANVVDVTTTAGYKDMVNALAHYNNGEVRALDIDEDEDGDGWRPVDGVTDTQEQTACISGYEAAIANLDAINPATTCNWVPATISNGMGNAFSTNTYTIIRFVKSDLGLTASTSSNLPSNSVITGGVAIGLIYFKDNPDLISKDPDIHVVNFYKSTAIDPKTKTKTSVYKNDYVRGADPTTLTSFNKMIQQDTKAAGYSNAPRLFPFLCK